MSEGRLSCVVTNDDGVDSEGLRQLAAAATSAGFGVVVAAPDREASGSGTAMTATTADGRIMISRRQLAGLPDIPAYAVQAVPAFIVFAAVRGAFGPRPDAVLSGINRGPNTGTAVLHSGTVGAAMTAALAGVPAAAFSLDSREPAGRAYWETAALVVRQVIPTLEGLRAGLVLNVNVPNVPPAELRGIYRASLAAAGAVQISLLHSTHEYIEVTLHDNPDEPLPGTDAALLAAGRASVTPLLAVCEAAADDLPWPTAPT